jgi:hypothetical protein
LELGGYHLAAFLSETCVKSTGAIFCRTEWLAGCRSAEPLRQGALRDGGVWIKEVASPNGKLAATMPLDLDYKKSIYLH